MKFLFPIVFLFLFQTSFAEIKNVILIVSDDHRYDFMGFMEKAPEFLETPGLDRMAKEGIHFENAFVSTSLCSPSRASILTGQYMHKHKVVDNQRPVPKGTVFFPEYLQKAGVETAFIGKWHMGHDDDNPRKGFDHWISFKGQGTYFDPLLNINGTQKQFKGYNADILTGLAIDWLKTKTEKRFYLQLSYKAVHYPFQPPKRHAERYEKKKIVYPETMALTEKNYQTQSKWMRERRYGIHGIDHMETGHFDKDPVPSFENWYKDYCETVHAVDENVEQVLNYLDKSGLSKNTLVLYMGDNGFELGEHGFYDKRDAFEESIRVPLLAWAPGNLKSAKVSKMVQNIDMAASIVDFYGIKAPEKADMDGSSFKPLMEGKDITWRDHILYEYHWEWNFPAVPTTLAIRNERYKYIYYHGIWDRNGFYDLKTDPVERHNLIDIPHFKDEIAKLRQQLFKELSERNALNLPIRPPKGVQFYDRKLRR